MAHAVLKTYTWDGEASAIRSMDLREDGQDVVAYIKASDGASNLYALRELFKKQGWASSPDMRDGAPVLRLTGVTDENALINLLQSNGYVSGTATSETAGTGKSASASKNPLAKLKSNTLRSSGLFYMLGDVLFIMSGIKRGNDLAQMGTGISFATGDAALMAFSAKDDHRQFNSILKKLRKYLEANGVAIPQDDAINTEIMAQPGGFLEKTYDFFHEHINVLKIMGEVVGGSLYFKAGINQKNPRKQAAGAIIVAGWAAALLLKEKRLDPEEYEKAGMLKKVAMQIQDRPLRLAGWAGLTHNALSTIGAFEERNKYRKGLEGGTPHYKWDLAGITAMLTANSLYSISNKATGGNIETAALINDVYGLAAQVLLHQPDAVREAVLQKTVDFLGQMHEIKDSRKQIETRLREAVENAKNNPWTEQVASSPSASAAPKRF